jgi:hypothetical protein
MFSGKLLVIVGAVLAVRVNRSPVEVVKRELQAVGFLCVPLDIAEKSRQRWPFLHSVTPSTTSSSVLTTGSREPAIIFLSTPAAKMFPAALTMRSGLHS